MLHCSGSDLAELRGMLKAPGGKLGSAAWAIISWPEVQEVPVGATLRAAYALTLKRPVEGSTPNLEGSARVYKRVKMTTIRHKSRRGIGKLAGNTPGDCGKKTERLTVRMPEAAGLAGVISKQVT
ncbi:hypothetical protein GW17_00044023 [Ensete ventricosum]|nr:hypothetical protein GW17_00044023 [Ensete ventricosum]